MTKLIVSICIPVYNGGHYLRQCIESCLEQAFSDYEIVVCDDGSTDGSIQVIEAYAAQHPKIRFYRNPQNLGLVGNWNRCLEEAKGEWVKFVFQDDYITTDCLAEFVKAANDKTMLVMCRRHFILPEHASKEEKNYYSQEVRTLENTTDHKGTEFSSQL
ncbi:MAG: glycosyltransferase family 2 protein, partial [Bacteroidia bacterium]